MRMLRRLGTGLVAAGSVLAIAASAGALASAPVGASLSAASRLAQRPQHGEPSQGENPLPVLRHPVLQRSNAIGNDRRFHYID